MKLRYIMLPILSGLLLITMTGCTKKVKESTIRKIKLGTSKDTVIKKLGKPLKTYTITENNKAVEILKYEAEPKDINDNDRVTRIIGQTCLCICTLGLWIPAAVVMESLFNFNDYWLIFSNDKLMRSTDDLSMTVWESKIR